MLSFVFVVLAVYFGITAIRATTNRGRIIRWALFGVSAVLAYLTRGVNFGFDSSLTLVIVLGLLSVGSLYAAYRNTGWRRWLWILIAVLMGISSYFSYRITHITAIEAPASEASEVEAPIVEAPTETMVTETKPQVAEVPDCFSINGDWETAFAKGLIYQVVPQTGGLPGDQFVFFEGVIANSNPKDLHSVFEVKSGFKAEQGNFWACGLVVNNNVKDTILFQSADKKWQNLDSQGLTHPIEVTTSDGKKHSFASGQKPDWYLDTDETNMVCPYTDKPYMQNPAGVIQADGTFVGAPGKAGCDFVAISPDGKAIRYSSSIDSFAYEAGTRFFLFDPKWSNEDLATQLNVAKIKNSK